MKVYEQNEMYQQFLAKLDMTVRSYNYVMDTLLDVERPLIENKIQQMVQKVEKVLLLSLFCVVYLSTNHCDVRIFRA